uniref:Uncharacterized protein n=1 Tax=Rhizophora mucronata TaxID=61149 RepID=A0A2P2PFH1_RHIMU
MIHVPQLSKLQEIVSIINPYIVLGKQKKKNLSQSIGASNICMQYLDAASRRFSL